MRKLGSSMKKQKKATKQAQRSREKCVQCYLCNGTGQRPAPKILTAEELAEEGGVTVDDLRAFYE